MRISRYNDFINESSENKSDLDIILDYIAKNIPSVEIPKLKLSLIPLKESVNENIFSDIKGALTRWFDDRIMKYIINKKKSFYTELIGKLNIFDLTTLDDVRDSFPGFKMRSIYLAGGMDKAKDVGAGWRARVEYEFEVINGGVEVNKDMIVIPYMGKNIEVYPSYVVDGENLTRFIEEGGNRFSLKYYDTPAILNPVRKEVDRTKNKKFADEMGKFKRGEYEDTKDPRAFDEISKIFSKTIEPEDEHIVRLCDAVFYGANEVSSGGTFAELQQVSFSRKPLFAWYIDGWKISGHSPWNLPHVSKVMRSDDDMKMFVKTMINYDK